MRIQSILRVCQQGLGYKEVGVLAAPAARAGAGAGAGAGR